MAEEIKWNRYVPDEHEGVEWQTYGQEPKVPSVSEKYKDAIKKNIGSDFGHTMKDVYDRNTNWLLGRDPFIDYETGIKDVKARAYLSLADTPGETRSAMDKLFGKGNWFQDRFGALIATPEGAKKFGIESDKPVAVDSPDWTPNRYDVADIAGDIAPILGGVGGGLLASGAGAPAGMLAVAGGTLLGRLAQEAGEEIAGVNQQTLPDVMKTAVPESIIAGAMEGPFRYPIRAGGRRLMAPEAHRLTPDKLQQLADAEHFGLKPSVSQATEAPLIGRMQRIGERIFGGNPLEAQNASTIAQIAERFKRDLGAPFRTKEAAGTKIKQTVVQQRKGLAKEAAKRYGEINKRIEDLDISPINGQRFKQGVVEIESQLPRDAAGDLIYPSTEVKKLMDTVRSLPDQMSVSNAQAMRTYLREALGDKTLTPGASDHIKATLKKAADDALNNFEIQDIETAVKLASRKGVSNPGKLLSDLEESLRNTNKWYAGEIKRFDDDLIKRVAKELGVKGSMEPENIVAEFFRPAKGARGSSTSRVRRLRRAVGEEQWPVVQRDAMESLMDNLVKTKRETTTVKGMFGAKELPEMDMTFNPVIDGPAFKRVLNSYDQGTLEAMFGKDATAELKRFANAASLITSKQKDWGGLAAAAIALRPISNLGKLIQIKFWRDLLSSETGRKWLITGFEAPKTRRGAEALARIAYQAELLGTEELGRQGTIQRLTGQDPEPIEQPQQPTQQQPQMQQPLQ